MDLTADGTEGAIGGTGGRGGDDDEDEEGEDALTSSASAEVQRCLVVGRYPSSGRHRRRIRRAGIGDAVAVSVVVAVVVAVVVVVVVVDMRCCEGGGEVTANGRDDERKSDDAATSRRLEALTIRPAIVILRLIVMIVFEFIRQVSVCVDIGSQISCAENASGGSQERYGFLRTSDIPLRRRGTDATLSSQEEERGMYLSYGIVNRNQLVFGHLITTTVPGFD